MIPDSKNPGFRTWRTRCVNLQNGILFINWSDDLFYKLQINLWRVQGKKKNNNKLDNTRDPLKADLILRFVRLSSFGISCLFVFKFYLWPLDLFTLYFFQFAFLTFSNITAATCEYLCLGRKALSYYARLRTVTVVSLYITVPLEAGHNQVNTD